MTADRNENLEQLLAPNEERLASIKRLTNLDLTRADSIDRLTRLADEYAAKVEYMKSLDDSRVAKINSMNEQDRQRVKQLNQLIELVEAQRVAVTELQKKVAEQQEQLAHRGRTDEDRVDTINQLLALDKDHIAAIERLTAYTKQQAEIIKQLSQLDSERVATIIRITGVMENQEKQRLAAIARLEDDLNATKASLENLSSEVVSSDGLVAHGRSLEFMHEPAFAKAWEASLQANREGWHNAVPDVRWRAAINLWAARQALLLEGDFVECGVHTGLFSLVILNALQAEMRGRSFYLFDTFNGIPLNGLSGAELANAEQSNKDYYFDVWAYAQRNFAAFPAAKLVRGVLPDTLASVNIGRIAYLSVDLNNAPPEKAVIERLWPQLVSGAIVVIDDYGWQKHAEQFEMWNSFASQVGHPIAPLPTGQGLLIKS